MKTEARWGAPGNFSELNACSLNAQLLYERELANAAQHYAGQTVEISQTGLYRCLDQDHTSEQTILLEIHFKGPHTLPCMPSRASRK